MARMARVVIPNYPHHVTQRGNWRQETFFHEDDYRNNTNLIKQHTRTGRPPSSTEFIRKLEIITGEELAPKRPGRNRLMVIGILSPELEQKNSGSRSRL